MIRIKNLIIVDDDDVYVFLTKKTIEQTNLVEHIKVFSNGRDAIKFLSENANNPDSLPEIILLDLSMPIMDGWQFLGEFTKLKPKTHKKIMIYIVTSSISPHDIDRANGMSDISDYLIKPITKGDLIEMIKKL